MRPSRECSVSCFAVRGQPQSQISKRGVEKALSEVEEDEELEAPARKQQVDVLIAEMVPILLVRGGPDRGDGFVLATSYNALIICESTLRSIRLHFYFQRLHNKTGTIWWFWPALPPQSRPTLLSPGRGLPQYIGQSEGRCCHQKPSLHRSQKWQKLHNNLS